MFMSEYQMNELLGKCGYCDAKIARQAIACPKCGGPWPLTGRSPTKLLVEECLFGLKLIANAPKQFSNTPPSYISLLMEVISRLSVVLIICGVLATLLSIPILNGLIIGYLSLLICVGAYAHIKHAIMKRRKNH